jgi:hypothetical protein
MCGFGVWGDKLPKDQKEKTSVTFPKQSYQTRSKEKRDYMILRPQPGMPPSTISELTSLILDAYEAERHVAYEAERHV